MFLGSLSIGIAGSWKAIFCGDIPWHRPYIGHIYGRYLQFRLLKWPLTLSPIWWFRSQSLLLKSIHITTCLLVKTIHSSIHVEEPIIPSMVVQQTTWPPYGNLNRNNGYHSSSVGIRGTSFSDVGIPPLRKNTSNLGASARPSDSSPAGCLSMASETTELLDSGRKCPKSRDENFMRLLLERRATSFFPRFSFTHSIYPLQTRVSNVMNNQKPF